MCLILISSIIHTDIVHFKTSNNRLKFSQYKTFCYICVPRKRVGLSKITMCSNNIVSMFNNNNTTTHAGVTSKYKELRIVIYPGRITRCKHVFGLPFLKNIKLQVTNIQNHNIPQLMPKCVHGLNIKRHCKMKTLSLKLLHNLHMCALLL